MISDATKDNLLLIDILQEASQSGNLVRLRRELENLEYEKDQLQSLINQNVEGQNVLVTAARNGHRKMVQWLIEHGYVLIVPDKVQIKIKINSARMLNLVAVASSILIYLRMFLHSGQHRRLVILRLSKHLYSKVQTLIQEQKQIQLH